MFYLLLWWFVVSAMGVLALPVTFTLFKYLPDKGYAFSKAFAVLIVGYFTWLAGYVMTYSARTVYVAILILGAASYLLVSRTWAALSEFMAAQRKYIWITEIIFLGVFLMAGAFKMRTFEIAGTEKPMDFALMNAILASAQMPPHDPWLAGGHISYYYGGYFIVASLAKLTGTPYGVNYNLGVALIWALTGLGGFGIGYALTRKYVYAAFPAVSLTALGNLDFWHRAIQSFQYGDLRAAYYNHPVDPSLSSGISGFIAFLFSPVERHWNYFQASRIIEVPPQDKLINEFPAFSFFLSDLHPHVMALPFVLLALGLAFNLMKAPARGLEIFGRDVRWRYALWALIAVVFGGLGFINSWDLPTALLVLGLCLTAGQSWAHGEFSKPWFLALALVGLPIVAASGLFYAPFYWKLQSQAEGVGFAPERTDIYFLFVLFGLFFAILLPALGGRAVRALLDRESLERPARSRRVECTFCGRRGAGKGVCKFCGGDLAPAVDGEVTPIVNEGARFRVQELGAWLSTANKSAWYGATLVGVIGGVLLVTTMGTFNLASTILSLLMILLALVSLTSKSDTKELVFATLLCAVGFGLIAMCEFFYVKDVFQGGALRRMNTIFKFHYQVWVLLSVASAPLLQWLIEKRWPEWSAWRRNAWVTIAGLSLFAAGIYPVLTSDTQAAPKDAAHPLTLDGTYTFRANHPDEAGAIDWIRNNVRGEVGAKAPVVLEAWGGSYTEYARISTQTGIPTVLGWDGHEHQWRGSDSRGLIRGKTTDDTLDQRRRDVDAIYTTTDQALARQLLRKYGVDYVFVGGLEREKYKNQLQGLGKFAQLGTPVYTQGSASLYRIGS
ncbi:MAG: DUF2298 domain-containing protein [Pyrinomonadaceae bacterium]